MRSMKSLSYKVGLILVIVVVVLPIDSWSRNKVYSPSNGVICDRAEKICYDQNGASIGLTKQYMGDKAAQNLQASMKKAGRRWNPTNFKLSNGIICDTKMKTCKNQSNTVDIDSTKKLFGTAPSIQTRPFQRPQAPKKETRNGHCRLENTVEKTIVYNDSCLIKQVTDIGRKKYVLKLNNGDQYVFLDKGNGFKAYTPKGLSNRRVGFTNKGDKVIFIWNIWKMVAK
jgi:hypothetical protein